MTQYPVVDGVEVLLAPPSGWVVNFTHPTRDYVTERDIKWAFGIEYPIATLFLIQRLYTSLYLVRKFLIDDYLMLLSWTLLSASCSMMLFLCDGGYVGIHAWEQSLDRTILMTGVLLGVTLTAILGTMLAKLVLCIFYYRLIPGRWYRYSIFFTAGLTTACFGLTFFINIFACHPISAAWNLRRVTSTNCISRPPFYLLQAIAGGVTDLLLMITPIPTVLRLQMSRKAKAAVIAWFSIGIITLAMSIMRLISLLSQLSSSDTPWNMPDAMLWLTVESNLVVLCGCLPTLRIFIRRMLPELAKRSTRASSSAKSSGKGFSFRTFGQGSRTRSRRHFDTLAEIDAIEDIHLHDTRHTMADDHMPGTMDDDDHHHHRTPANSSRNGSEDLIIQHITSDFRRPSGLTPSSQEADLGSAWAESNFPKVSVKRM